jgi:DNA repair protein RadD
MNFRSFLTRADDEILQDLLGANALRLLRALDTTGFTQSRQRELLLDQSKPQELLHNSRTRKILFELLRQDEAITLCKLLDITYKDPYLALRDASISQDKYSRILDYFELNPFQQEDAPEAEAMRSINTAYPLFHHQALAARRAIQKLRSGERRVLLHMPTGSGKTRTAMNIIAERLRALPDLSVIWLAHSEELCDQAADEFEKAWSFLGSHEVKIHRFWGNREIDLAQIKGSFIVAGLPKMNALISRNIAAIGSLGKAASLVVMDEAHQAIAPTYQLILDALVVPYPNTSLLGLSATPGRSWNDPDSDEKLARYFCKQKVVLEVSGYENPVDYLIKERYLAKVDFRSVLSQSGFNLTEKDQQRIEKNFDIPQDILEKLAENEVRNLVIISEIEQLVKRNSRIIVFGTTVEHSNLLAYILRARGIWARSVTGTTPGSERSKILDQFKAADQEPRVLCNFGVLTTGFDAPRTSAAVIARPTNSLVLYSQMIGRAIRGTRAGGNATAEIVTVVDSGLPGFGDVGEAFLNWEDVWGG